MATAKSRTPAAAYRFQRHHPALIPGSCLVTKQKREEPMRVFFPQSDIDGACGLHVLCSALVALDLAKSSALADMPKRKHGVPARVWEVFAHTYFSGVNPPEFVDLVKSLELPVQVTARHGHAEGVDAAALDWLMRGDLVALAFESVVNSRTRHWALAVGAEGNCVGRKDVPDTILLLDPGATEPHYGVANAWLKVSAANGSSKSQTVDSSTRMKSKRMVWNYESACFPTEQVHLISAVRLKPEAWS